MEGYNNTYTPDVEAYEDEAAYLTIDEATALIEAESTRLARAESLYDEARRNFALDVANVPAVDGDEGDRLRAKVLAKYLPALEEAEQEAAGIAETVHLNMAAVFNQTRQAQYDFSPEEHQLIEARRNIVKEDVANLNYGRLVGAVQYAILTGDRPAMALYSRYVPERLAYGENSGSWQDTAARREKSELQRMLRTIDKRLKNDTLATVNQKAGDLLTRAGTLQRAAKRRELESRPYAFRSEGEVAW